MTAEDTLYGIYLNAFAAMRSGSELAYPKSSDLASLAARAMGVSDASCLDFSPAPKWVLLSDVDRLLNSKEPEEAACKVVPMEGGT